MAKRILQSKRAFKWTGNYVHAVEISNCRMIFTSGFTARDAAGVIVGRGDVAAQTRQCLDNVIGAVEAAGGSVRDIVRLTTYIKDIRDFDAMNAVRKEVLGDVQVASATIEARFISPDALVEMEAVAAIE
jgi:enamine deaminase RidA (YjgF/YER057c/UK114 family)